MFRARAPRHARHRPSFGVCRARLVLEERRFNTDRAANDRLQTKRGNQFPARRCTTVAGDDADLHLPSSPRIRRLDCVTGVAASNWSQLSCGLIVGTSSMQAQGREDPHYTSLKSSSEFGWSTLLAELRSYRNSEGSGPVAPTAKIAIVLGVQAKAPQPTGSGEIGALHG